MTPCRNTDRHVCAKQGFTIRILTVKNKSLQLEYQFVGVSNVLVVSPKNVNNPGQK